MSKTPSWLQFYCFRKIAFFHQSIDTLEYNKVLIVREIACSLVIQNNSLWVVQCFVVDINRHIECSKVFLKEIAYSLFVKAHISENFFYVGLVYH